VIGKSAGLSLFALFIIILIGCGGIRYSSLAPDAEDFHPKKIGVLPVYVGPFEEARGIIDQVIAGVLIEKGWFTDVVAPDTVKGQMQSNDDLRKAVFGYIAKLRTVNFSDPDLSRKIGEGYHVDAFLVVNLDYWDYTTEREDKIARVGLGLKLVEAGTGNIIWKACHSIAKDYWLFKPDLSDVAKDVVKKMLNYMPH
jgi:hypothetical protein